jgi:hypothetical protein
MPKEYPAKFSAVYKSRMFDKYININTTCLLIHLMISYIHIMWFWTRPTFKFSTWEYELLRSPTSSQEMALLESLLDLSRPWEFVDRIYEEGLVVGWLTSIGYGGKVLVTPKDRLEN